MPVKIDADWKAQLQATVPELPFDKQRRFFAQYQLPYTITAVLVPAGVDADRLRNVILERFDMSLGTGLGKLKGRIFRIGHLGDFNDLTLAGTLSGVEMGLALAGVPFRKGGVAAALEYLASTSK